MKKYASLILVGTFATVLASCGENKEEKSQAQIDSAVQAETAAKEAEMTRQNDSLINAMAVMKADSARLADSMANASKTVTVSKHTVTKTKTTTPKPTTSTGPKKVTDRPGATDANVNNQTEKPKPVTDRPGATTSTPNK